MSSIADASCCSSPLRPAMPLENSLPRASTADSLDGPATHGLASCVTAAAASSVVPTSVMEVGR
eukprot:2834921-Prymnesium_polylepis.1